MSLVNQTCWVVGGVGVVGKSITRGLLKAGATVIVNSRSTDRLDKFQDDLGYPDRLISVHGSLLPGYAAKTVGDTLSALPLDHVVAHGAVRYWATTENQAHPSRYGYDETHSMLRPTSAGGLLQMTSEDFSLAASYLASLHFSAAQELIPRIQFSRGASSYTFLTGDGGGHPRGIRSAFGDINSHHMWGLSAALRNDDSSSSGTVVNYREIRVTALVNRTLEERERHPRKAPLSEDIGRLCAGVVSNVDNADAGALLEVKDEETLEALLSVYGCNVAKHAEEKEE